MVDGVVIVNGIDDVESCIVIDDSVSSLKNVGVSDVVIEKLVL